MKMHDCEMPKKSTLNTERMSNKTIVDAMAYLENFNGVFLSVAYGGHLYFVFSVCDVTI